jgi:hypothetical protein
MTFETQATMSNIPLKVNRKTASRRSSTAIAMPSTHVLGTEEFQARDDTL